MVIKSYSVKDTGKFARSLAKKFLKKGGVIGLIGGLGSGKTIFAQGFAKGLGIKEKIISPTFILMRQHKILASLAPQDDIGGKFFYHLDLYRLEDQSALNQLGISEILDNGNKGDIVIIEWAEKIMDKLPKNTLKIIFEKTGKNSRKLTVKNM